MLELCARCFGPCQQIAVGCPGSDYTAERRRCYWTSARLTPDEDTGEVEWLDSQHAPRRPAGKMTQEYLHSLPKRFVGSSRDLAWVKMPDIGRLQLSNQFAFARYCASNIGLLFGFGGTRQSSYNGETSGHFAPAG
jgi:hypothetical protein